MSCRVGPQGDVPGVRRQREGAFPADSLGRNGKAGYTSLGLASVSNVGSLWGQGLSLVVWYLALVLQSQRGHMSVNLQRCDKVGRY